MTAAPADGATLVREAGDAAAAGGRSSAAPPRGAANGLPRWRRGPVPIVALLAAIVAVAVIGVLARASGNAGTLDPDGTSPQGSRALAVLLRDRGTVVERVATVSAALIGRSSATTIFIPDSDLIPAEAIAALAGSGGPVVLVNPSAATLAHLMPGLAIVGSAPPKERLPGCDLAAAVVAGGVDLGGATYHARGDSGAPSYSGCYPAGGDPIVVAGVADSGPSVTVVGSGLPFRNDALAKHGNAAFALSLLGTGDRVRWLLPRPGDVAPGSAHRGLLDLLPGRLLLALLQLAIAVGLVALWRGRRLGPVVAEQLPVVVRSAETTEGRARLYRATSARTAAAAALRAGARARLAARAGLNPEASPPAIIDAVARRTARPPADVAALLYGGGEIPHDAALVRLAEDLDALDLDIPDIAPVDRTTPDPEVPRS